MSKLAENLLRALDELNTATSDVDNGGATDITDDTDQKASDYSKVVRCGNCGKESPVGTKQCPKCQEFLYGKERGSGKEDIKSEETDKTAADAADVGGTTGDNMMKCPNCKKMIPDESTVCPACHAVITADDYNGDDEQNASLTGEDEVTTIKSEDDECDCKDCGSKITKQTKFCSECGAKNAVEEPEKIDKATKFSKCPECGTNVELGVKSCTNCGHAIPVESATQTQAENGTKEKDVEPEKTKDADPEAKKAQEERSKQYGISVKKGGKLTKPSQWDHVEEKNWGDPVNWAYPMPDEIHAKNAAARWGDESNRAKYSSDEQEVISNRIANRVKEFTQTEVAEKADDQKSDTDISTNANEEVVQPKLEADTDKGADEIVATPEEGVEVTTAEGDTIELDDATKSAVDTGEETVDIATRLERTMAEFALSEGRPELSAEQAASLKEVIDNFTVAKGDEAQGKETAADTTQTGDEPLLKGEATVEKPEANQETEEDIDPVWEQALMKATESVLHLKSLEIEQKRGQRHSKKDQHLVGGLHSMVVALGYNGCRPTNTSDPDNDGDNDMADNDAPAAAAPGATMDASEVETIVKELEAKKEQLQATIDESTKELESLNLRFAETTKAYNDVLDKSRESEGKVNARTSDIEAKSEEVGRLSAEIDQKHAELLKVSEELTAKTAELTSTEESVKVKSEELAEDLKKKQEEFDQMNSEYTKKRKEVEAFYNREMPSPLHTRSMIPTEKKSTGSATTMTTREFLSSRK